MSTGGKGTTAKRIFLIFFLILAFTGIGILLQVFVRQSKELADLEAAQGTESEIQAQIESKDKEIEELGNTKAQINNELTAQKNAAEEQKQEQENMKTDSVEAGLPEVQAIIENTLKDQPGTWAVYVKDIESGQAAKYNDDEQIKGAELLRLYVMGAAYNYWTQNGAAPDGLPDMIHKMMGNDDESAEQAAQVLNQIGGSDYINKYVQENSYNKTSLEDQFGEGSTTSASDCGKFLESIYQGSINNLAGDRDSDNTSERMMANLRGQKTTGQIPQGIQGAGFANRTGELTGVEDEAAIVFTENGEYILCVMSQDIENESAKEIIKNLSEQIYNYFSNTESDTGSDAEAETESKPDTGSEVEPGADTDTGAEVESGTDVESDAE